MAWQYWIIYKDLEAIQADLTHPSHRRQKPPPKKNNHHHQENLHDADTNVKEPAKEKYSAAGAGSLVLPAISPMSHSTINQISLSGSSVWCSGAQHTERICKFHNLCFLASQQEFVFFHGDQTVQGGLPSDRFQPALLDLSTVHDHNAHYFQYVDLPAAQATSLLKNAQIVLPPALLMNRFNSENIMHVLHDDILPLFDTLRMMHSHDLLHKQIDTQLVFMEGWEPGPYSSMYDLLSSYKPIYKNTLMQQKNPYCFADVTVGISKRTTWYHYGFTSPQGPMTNINVTARDVKLFTDYTRQKLGVKAESVATSNLAVIVSRMENRLIMNENELVFSLVQKLRLKVTKISLETHSLQEIIDVVSKARVMVGMHGSLLSLAMYLSPGSILLELFPYGVPPEQYTPYKTMANLPGMGISYKVWRNMDESRTYPHPDWPAALGGIQHLPIENQTHIRSSQEVKPHICCSDPEWLYRIYQDTEVNCAEITSLIKEAMALAVVPAVDTKHSLKIFPSQVYDINCTVKASDKPGKSVTVLVLTWQPPWNLKYINDNTVQYEIWVQESDQESYKEWIVTGTSHIIDKGIKPQVSYIAWIRCILSDAVIGPFNSKAGVCDNNRHVLTQL